MKTVTVSNIKLLFDTSEKGEAKDQALQFIDFLNEVLEKMGLPDSPQIIALDTEVEVSELDWAAKGWD